METTSPQNSDFRYRRRPWTAVALSLLLPGLGHIYCGDIKSGLPVILIIMMFPLLWMVGTLKEGRIIGPLAFMMWGIVLLATILASIHVWFLARQTRWDYRLKDYNRWDVYLCLIAISVGGTLWYAIYFRDKVMEAFRVPSVSMYPSIDRGDRLIANKLAYQQDPPAIGDIVLFTNPADRHQSYIKRIVALPGDIVELRDGKLWINKQPLQSQSVPVTGVAKGDRTMKGQTFLETNRGKTYPIFLSDMPDADHAAKNFGPVQIPEHHCFVMGDNRFDSRDSRHFGTLPLVCLRGKFAAIYWPAQGWSRFGPLR
ncbi:MAG: signal peptidase I [Phycisphaerae bacterium]|nr:signal peptidase I [Phycisphaerae bacterium]